MDTLEARVVDSTHLELSEPIDTPSGSRIVVSLADRKELEDRELWLAASSQGLESAYGDDEPEYTLDMIREPNPELSE